MTQDASRLIWIDLEMTGLDSSNDQIIEIATVVTDANLETVAEGPVIAIHQSEDVIEGMDEWNTRTHGESGLIQRVRESWYSVSEAETKTLEFLETWVPAGVSPMCGNSICQDRRFMARLMPDLEAFFHYRNLDVSTLKELAKRWAPEVAQGLVKQVNHVALDDVYDSINELKYYREHLFQLPEKNSLMTR